METSFVFGLIAATLATVVGALLAYSALKVKTRGGEVRGIHLGDTSRLPRSGLRGRPLLDVPPRPGVEPDLRDDLASGDIAGLHPPAVLDPHSLRQPGPGLERARGGLTGGRRRLLQDLHEGHHAADQERPLQQPRLHVRRLSQGARRSDNPDDRADHDLHGPSPALLQHQHALQLDRHRRGRFRGLHGDHSPLAGSRCASCAAIGAASGRGSARDRLLREDISSRAAETNERRSRNERNEPHRREGQEGGQGAGLRHRRDRRVLGLEGFIREEISGHRGRVQEEVRARDPAPDGQGR